MKQPIAEVKKTDTSAQIAFLHTLRGIAPLLVLWAHLGGWWLAEAGQSSVLQNYWINLVSRPLHLHQDGGHLGVLIFFLVSGFVITHVSLRETWVEFLVKRTFRLVPTLLLAVAMLPLLVWLQGVLGLPPKVMGNQSDHYVSGVFFLNYFTGAPQVLSVLWTLFIEIIFYAMTLGLIGMSRTRPLAATWWMLGLTHAWNMLAIVFPALHPAMWGVMYIPFLLVGRCIYLGWAKQATPLQAWVVGSFCYGSFLLIYNGVSPGLLLKDGSEPVISHFLAIGLFLGLCTAGMKSTMRPLAFTADVSYALYLIHAPLGAFLLFFLTKQGLVYEIALPIAVSLVLAVSYAINRLVEIPAQNAGRNVCRRLRKQT